MRRKEVSGDGPSGAKGERLQKILARAGYGSRRACEQLILDGRVKVDGRTVRELGTRAASGSDRITVDGAPVRVARPVYYVVNKPPGVISTMEDDAKGRRVVDLVPAKVRVFPVGRLEADSEGLMLLTNDGELSHRLTHPSYEVRRVYVAEVGGAVSDEAIDKLQRGVFLAEGRTMPAEVKAIRRGARGGTLEIAIREGINREVRRMLVAVGLKPRTIVRTGFGSLSLGKLGSGEYRRLSGAEVSALRASLPEEPRSRPAWVRRARGRQGGGRAAGGKVSSGAASPASPARKRRRVIGDSRD